LFKQNNIKATDYDPIFVFDLLDEMPFLLNLVRPKSTNVLTVTFKSVQFIVSCPLLNV